MTVAKINIKKYSVHVFGLTGMKAINTIYVPEQSFKTQQGNTVILLIVCCNVVPYCDPAAFKLNAVSQSLPLTAAEKAQTGSFSESFILCKFKFTQSCLTKSRKLSSVFINIFGLNVPIGKYSVMTFFMVKSIRVLHC